MEPYFIIFQSSTVANRPPISFKVREYLEQFITDRVLQKKKIILNGKWKVILAIYFTERSAQSSFKDIGMAKGARTIAEESSKMYEVVIQVNTIEESEQPYLTTIRFMYEAIKMFLTTTYKKVTPEFMDNLWKEVDLDYLLSLPYPAPIEEQRYLGDR